MLRVEMANKQKLEIVISSVISQENTTAARLP